LFERQLKDLYSAETQLVTALPLMAENAKDGRLRAGFTKHLTEQRLYTIGHEVAHHWWHASPYPNSQFQSYLNEGFAEYACLACRLARACRAGGWSACSAVF
jgi:hypothetical protein